MSTTDADRAAATAQQDFMSGIRPANVVPEIYYFGLHIGPPGSGKTHTLGTMPGRVLVLDCRDGGVGTAPLIEHGGRVDVRAVPDWETLKEAMRFLDKATYEYDSVAIDGLTKLQGYDLQYIIENTKRADGSRPIQMERDMWGTALEHFTLMANWLERIHNERKFHFAATAWEKELGGENEATADNMIPALQGQIKNTIAGMFDIVVYHTSRALKEETEAGQPEVEYAALSVRYGPRLHAKCRWKRVVEGEVVSALEPIEVNPNIADWVERMRAGRNEIAELRGLSTGAEKPSPGPAAETSPRGGEQERAEPEIAAPAASEEVPAEQGEHADEAAELAASAQAMPSKAEMLKNVEMWWKENTKRYPERKEEIDQKLQSTASDLGVKKVLSELEVGDLGILIERLMEFENTLA